MKAARALRILERFFYFTKQQESFNTSMETLAAQDRSLLDLSRSLAYRSHGDANTLQAAQQQLGELRIA
ncbi:hypothetical protein C1924_00480 [Stenotrophomonas sp. ESTM1D_MKCIP4_1]|uniref:hypothetical protein n=1 Tax=Stenotrophomonas sp. ESTM1D_MKCIP4_1 TaxID=2072414 RepID=UPI000D53FB34|nr:hypothetical protein [Stenotrophomonas sp. ESTM1D_MKCIP4_1]AWH51772.1 hypothetical protein C1924_00480 [Stenotrophomonas sp. ESTM1D_MKCIP4_1]